MREYPKIKNYGNIVIFDPSKKYEKNEAKRIIFNLFPWENTEFYFSKMLDRSPFNTIILWSLLNSLAVDLKRFYNSRIDMNVLSQVWILETHVNQMPHFDPDHKYLSSDARRDILRYFPWSFTEFQFSKTLDESDSFKEIRWSLLNQLVNVLKNYY